MPRTSHPDALTPARLRACHRVLAAVQACAAASEPLTISRIARRSGYCRSFVWHTLRRIARWYGYITLPPPHTKRGLRYTEPAVLHGDMT